MNLPQSQIQTVVVFKTRGCQNQPGPVLNSATSETDVSEIKESESVIEDEEEKSNRKLEIFVKILNTNKQTEHEF